MNNISGSTKLLGLQLAVLSAIRTLESDDYGDYETLSEMAVKARQALLQGIEQYGTLPKESE